LIRIGVSGESSFWYRPTRVVPDQRPLNGRCCCCNSLLHDVFCMRLMLYNDSDTLLKMAFDTVGNVLQFVSLKS